METSNIKATTISTELLSLATTSRLLVLSPQLQDRNRNSEVAGAVDEAVEDKVMDTEAVHVKIRQTRHVIGV